MSRPAFPAAGSAASLHPHGADAATLKPPSTASPVAALTPPVLRCYAATLPGRPARCCAVTAPYRAASAHRVASHCAVTVATSRCRSLCCAAATLSCRSLSCHRHSPTRPPLLLRAPGSAALCYRYCVSLLLQPLLGAVCAVPPYKYSLCLRVQRPTSRFVAEQPLSWHGKSICLDVWEDEGVVVLDKLGRRLIILFGY